MRRTVFSDSVDESMLPDHAMRRALMTAPDVHAIVSVARDLPRLQLELGGLGVDAAHQGRRVAAIVDALTIRLIELAEAGLPTVPGRYAWLACGSQGRAEQTVHTDQDNALVYEDNLPASSDVWFRRLAEQVTDGLAACGIPHCPGGVSPRSADWRRSVSDWRRVFRATLARPDRRSVMLATHYFDMRVVHGESELFDGVREEALMAVPDSQRFLHQSARNVIRQPPPLGLFRRFRTTRRGPNPRTLDLKRYGLLPISQLALHHALRGGLPQRHTVDRLLAAADAGLIVESTADDLVTAHDCLAELRLRHLNHRLERKQPLDNALPLGDVGPLERHFLRRSLGVIGIMRKGLELSTEA